jgi:hypothetical protein
MKEWAPIETAPKDGTKIIGYQPKTDDEGEIINVMEWMPRQSWHRSDFTGLWVEAHGEQYESYKPTHWMPLPEPPKL